MATMVTTGLVTGSRFCVLDYPFFGQFLDHSDALLAERVAKNTHNLESPGLTAFGVPHAALRDGHFRQGNESTLVRRGPTDSPAQVIHFVLVIGVRYAHRAARPFQQVLCYQLLFCRNRSCHASSLVSDVVLDRSTGLTDRQGFNGAIAREGKTLLRLQTGT
jgi:hypothetical protein